MSEPIAWLYKKKDGTQVITDDPDYADGTWIPLYTAPPQREQGCAECNRLASDGWALYCVKCSEPLREWVGLTDEEMFAALVQVDPLTKRLAPGFEYFARAIEQALKEKNG